MTVGNAAQGIHVDHHAMWMDPNDPERMIVGNDGGIGITWDKGGNYDFPNALALGQFYAPPVYADEWRCDLHPRASRDGRLRTRAWSRSPSCLHRVEACFSHRLGLPCS